MNQFYNLQYRVEADITSKISETTWKSLTAKQPRGCDIAK